MTAATITTAPIDPLAALEAVQGASNGAATLFVGTVRNVNDGRAVTGIEYSAYESMAQRELDAIIGEARERFDMCDLMVVHRVGELEIGEASVVVAAAHPHRAPSFDACRYVIEELKKRVPIWKRERYVDGALEWVDPTAAARSV